MFASGSVNVSPNAADASNLPVGAITLWSTSFAPTGYLLCDGTAYSKFTYPSLYNVIGTSWGVGYGSTVNINNSVGSVGNTSQNTITFTAGSVPAALQIAGTQFIMSNRGFSEDTYTWTVYSYSSGTPSKIVATAVVTATGAQVLFSTTPNGNSGTVTDILANTFAVPNTSQRVVRGIYPSTYVLGSTGGADNITISAANLPQHRHTMNQYLGTISAGGTTAAGGVATKVFTDASGTGTGTYADDGTTKSTNSAIDSRNAYVSIPYIIKY